ncbi:MAG TPA: Flp family type IVb pilin [Devosia sp.]|nr:Flp family type IVb pilin [Devosia sp.]
MALIAAGSTLDGAAIAIEYGLIAALISVALIKAATLVGGSLEGIFYQINEALGGTGAPA